MATAWLLCQGARRRFGGFDRDMAATLAVRHGHGSLCMPDAFRQELHARACRLSSA